MKKFSLIFIVPVVTGFLLQGCSDTSRKAGFPAKPVVPGLFSPVALQPDSTVIYLTDYFPDASKIDSVRVPGCFSFRKDTGAKTITLKNRNNDFPFLSELTVFSQGSAYSIFLKKSSKLIKTVVYNPGKAVCKYVQIAGEFNNWTPSGSAFTFANGKWTKDIYVEAGTYQYQLVVDGKWQLDPANPDTASNGIGGINSVMRVYNISTAKPPQIFTESLSGKKISIYAQNADSLYVLWQNFRLPQKLVSKSDSACTIVIPQEADNCGRSFIRVFACNKAGISNDILIPLKFGNVINDAKELTRKDPEAQVMYFMMVDRFFDKDKTNNKPIKDAEVDAKANYMGGDFAGIQSKIEDGFFTDLGVNSLWISPVNLNPDKAYREYPEPHRKFSGYHGYWPISSTKVDYRFGTDLEFLRLVQYAHRNNLNVILDYVANHVHEDHPLYKQHPDWATALNLPGGKKNIRLWDEQRLTTWFDTFLPTLDFSKKEVVECMTDSALYWINTYNLDGFRHDATKHIPEYYWRTLTKKIKDNNSKTGSPFFQIGETYGSRDLIGSYVNSGELDAQFDFNLYFDMRSTLLNPYESFSKISESVSSSLKYYGYHNLMGNITGNQDNARFISYASGALSTKEDDKEAGWKRNIEVKDPVGYKKLSMLTALVMTLPGIPVIYYGDEIGMAGAGDPDNRRMMMFEKLNSYQSQTKETAKKLIKLRRTNMPLIYGDYVALLSPDATMAYNMKDVFVFARIYFDKLTIVAFNKGTSAQTLNFKLPKTFCKKNIKMTANFGNDFKTADDKVSIKLEGNTFEVLTN